MAGKGGTTQACRYQERGRGRPARDPCVLWRDETESNESSWKSSVGNSIVRVVRFLCLSTLLSSESVCSGQQDCKL